MANHGKKKIWVLVKRLDLGEDKDDLKEVQFQTALSSTDFNSTLRSECSIPENVVLKLRNHRGSLIPITANIATNSRNVPYLLEVVNVAQNIEPQRRTIEWPCYNETIAANLQNIVNRVEKLEQSIPDLEDKRCSKISLEVQDMDRKMEFLNKRFDEADNTSWKGMFKRHPLW